MKYRTIVVDPPWSYKTTLPGFGGGIGPRSSVPYSTMTVDQIKALPILGLADTRGSHLYLWTTNTHLESAFGVLRSWGFVFSTVLVWAKKPRGSAGFPAYSGITEYVLFARRGSCRSEARIDRNWWVWPRGRHSTKPAAFFDLIERVSPGPRIELFARTQRLGWDSWGDEALCHVEMATR